MKYLRQTPNILLRRLTIVICFSLMFVADSLAQRVQSLPYNLNISNHLPSNHVYGSVFDQLGYLWITTPKGIVRYNGYEARLFNVNKGLPTDNVWCLMEDKAGRMWFNSMSYELGYIQNNHYHAVLKNTKGFVVPKVITRYKDGMAVTIEEYELLNAKNIQRLILFDSVSGLKIITVSKRSGEIILNRKGNLELIRLHNSLFFQGTIRDTGLVWNPAIQFDSVKLARLRAYTVSQQLSGDRLYGITKNNNAFRYLNTRTGEVEKITCSFRQSDEKTVYGYTCDSFFVVSSTGGIYLYDLSDKLIAHYPFASLTGNEKLYDEQPCIFQEYPLWGLTLGTSDMGMYIRGKDSSAFIPAKELELGGYGFIGSPGINSGVWWHPGKHQMKILYNDTKTADLKIPYLDQVKGMSACADGNIILSKDKGYMWLTLNRKRLPVFTDEKNNPTDFALFITSPVALNKDSVFMIESGAPYKFLALFNGQYRVLSATYFNKMTLDKGRHGIWMYRNQVAAFYNIKKNTFRYFYPDTLRKAGLRKVEEIFVDEKYGNLFIKDYDKIYMVDEHFSHAQPVFPNLCCNNAYIVVQDGRLLVAGRFGLLCCDITGKGKLSKERWYENYKDIYYKQVYGVQLLGTWAIVNTDKGAFRVSLNDGSGSLSRNKASGYRFIAYANDAPVRIDAHDTLILQPGTASIEWDVINPKGTGKLELAYLNDEVGTWNALSGNELNLSGFLPGKWYKLYLKAKDDIWQSGQLPVYIYLQPYWWQTTSFLLLMICCGVLLTIIVALVTRRIVIYKQRQKRQVAEMGLAGIYAQINPHFIFNSLNTAQFFIKANQMQEAYSHINRFSKLLRSFLHASRHRYITIEEEIINLKNYIELQQTRFTEPFDYRINLLPEIDKQVKIPSLLLQPLVENAIQHGLFNRKEKGGMLLITFEKRAGHLAITIEDNGIGRALAKGLQHELKKESYGNDLIQKLIFVFNKYEKIDINITYIDKVAPETGTIVKVAMTNPHI